MRVGERVRIMRLDRPTDQDRDEFVELEGLLVRRLNVPWNPGFGALWEVRFDNRETAVFSDSELAVLGSDGEPIPNDMNELKESWGEAPRGPSLPFRRLGGGTTGPALLALLVFALAGILLVWAGVAEESLALGLAGAVVALLGVLSAAFLVS